MTTTVTPLSDCQHHAELILAHQRGLATFKAQVREQVLRMRMRHGWCESGTNAVLIRLRLLPLRHSYSGTAVIDVRLDHIPDSWHGDNLRERITQDLAVRFTDDRIRFSHTSVDAEHYPHIAVHVRIDELAGTDSDYAARRAINDTVAIDFADTTVRATLLRGVSTLDERID